MRNSDIYHALSPMESFYLDPKKSVVTILDFIPLFENTEETDKFKNFTKFFYEKAVKKSIKFEKIITISEETSNDLKSHYNVDDEKIHSIRLAIDRKYHPKNIKNDIFTIGTVSGLGSRKRIDILIKSFFWMQILKILDC